MTTSTSASTRTIEVSVGQGTASGRAREVVSREVDAAVPGAVVKVVADLLEQLPARRESWFSGNLWKNLQRRATEWVGSDLCMVDVDCHESSRKAVPEPEVRMVVAQVLLDGELPGNLAYQTPHGFRILFVMDRRCSDAAEIAEIARCAAGLVDDALKAAGLFGESDGLSVDRATMDLARFMYAPRALVNGVQRDAKVQVLRGRPYAADELVIVGSSQSQRRENVIDEEELLEALGFIPAGDREVWLLVGMGIKDAMGDAGFEIWDRWSRTCEEKYDAEDCARVWESFHGSGVTAATVFHFARAHGWNPSRKQDPPPKWSRPRPLVSDAGLPRFPIDAAFPPALGWLRSYAASVGVCYQVPVELPVMLVFAVASLGASKVFEVEPQPGWLEPLPLWMLVLLGSGERKSAVFAKILAPVHAWMRERGVDLQPEVAEHLTKVDVLQKRLKAARAKAATDEGAQVEARDLAIELDHLERSIPRAPSFITSDATTEALAKVMVENDERALVASPEGDAIDVLLGRYSETPNLGIWLSGHAGDSVETRRCGRDPDRLGRPALATALAVQPEAIRGLLTNRQAAGRGLLARFLMSAPSSMVGYRDLHPPAVPEDQEFWWTSAIQDLLDQPVPQEPRRVGLDEEAARLFADFRQRVEDDLRPNGALADRREWASKLPGAVLRLAGVMLSLQVVGGSPCGDTIDGPTMHAALSWADYLVAQERHVSALAGEDPAVSVAEKLVRWIRRKGELEFSRRDAFNGTRGGVVVKVVDVDPGLDLLEEYGWIRAVLDTPSGRPGRRPSPRFLVNPIVLSS